MMRTAASDIVELERQLGPRGTTEIRSHNRHLVQNWLCAQGIPSERAKAMKIATLWKCYNKPNYLAAVLRHIRDGQPIAAGSELAGDIFSAKLAEDSGGSDDNGTLFGTIGTAQADSRSSAGQSKAERLASLIRDISSESVDETRVIELIQQHAPRPKAISVTLAEANGTTRDLGICHKQFPQLLKACSARDHKGNRLNIWLSGPPGSGKTSAAESVAAALDLPFHFNGAIDNEYKLLGFVDAQGKLVSRPFRQAYEHGGVYLFDEIDASLPGALLAFNAATANGCADFPDGIVKRHPDCVIIAAGNTFGHGGTSDFTGRMKQDAAFLDRFAFMAWEIDKDLETELCPDKKWSGYVQAVRERVARNGLKVIVSPRASLYGASLIAAGLSWENAVAMTLRKGMSSEQWESVA
jgi:hypothetical protein